jgi:membrane protein DedA with SNARE-associated domain
VVDWVVETLTPVFRDWGLLIVFIATFLESGVFVASIVPGETVLLLGGFFASPEAVAVAGGHPLDLSEVMAVAFAGAVVGDFAGYWIGRVAGRAIVRKVGRYFFLPERRLPLLERYFRRYGARAIFLGRFAPFLRSIRTLVAGIAHMPFPRFAIPDVAGAAAWVAGITGAGFLLGESWRVADRYLGAGGAVVLVLLVLVFIVTWRRVRRRFEEEIAAPHAQGDPEQASGAGS